MQLTLQDAFALAGRHEAAGRASDARRIYEEILAALPDHPGALLKIALQELAAGAHPSAQARLERALASAQRDGLPAQDIWLALARARLAAGEARAAADAIAEAHALAKRLKALGAIGAAHAILSECVELAPRDAALRMTLGAVLLDANRPSEARSELERAIELGEKSGEGWDNLGIV